MGPSIIAIFIILMGPVTVISVGEGGVPLMRMIGGGGN